ncbi:MAG: helix-turn-helix domain-containing protein [Bacteroidia bacterium]
MHDQKIIIIDKTDLEELIQGAVKNAVQNAQKAKPTDELMDVNQASKFLHLAKQTLYGLTSERLIPYLKRGKRIYFKKEELLNWVNQGKMKTREEIVNEGRVR